MVIFDFFFSEHNIKLFLIFRAFFILCPFFFFLCSFYLIFFKFTGHIFLDFVLFLLCITIDGPIRTHSVLQGVVAGDIATWIGNIILYKYFKVSNSSVKNKLLYHLKFNCGVNCKVKNMYILQIYINMYYYLRIFFFLIYIF